MEREKKNIPRILTKLGGVVGSLCETIQKKFALPRWKGRRAGGSQRASSFEKKNVFLKVETIKRHIYGPYQTYLPNLPFYNVTKRKPPHISPPNRPKSPIFGYVLQVWIIY